MNPAEEPASVAQVPSDRAEGGSDFGSPESKQSDSANQEPSSPSFKVEWIDDPVASDPSGEGHYFNKVQITIGNGLPFVVCQGDAVSVNTVGDKQQACLVRRFLDLDGKVVMEGNWCLSQKDIVEKLGSALTPEMEEFLDLLCCNEIVLTNITDEIDISCILGACSIQYKKSTDDVRSLSSSVIFCRYRLHINNAKKTIDWKELLEPEALGMDTEDEEDAKQGGNKEEDDKMDEEPIQADDDVEMAEEETATVGTALSASDDEDCDSLSTSRAPIQGEGSNFDGEIRIGAKFQVALTPFVPNCKVKSRGAKQVYKANVLSDDELTGFLTEVAKLHIQFLAEQKMTFREPYILLHQERSSEFVAHLPADHTITGSIMSTASSMGGTRVPLLKECNPDAVLELLSDHKYDTEKALSAIKDDLDAITCGWTQPEKGVFDAGFRRHEGELREIGRVLHPTKSVKDVVDYHYRFKIPEQFRKYQNKKREHALRVAECIQTRKYGDALNGGGAVPPPVVHTNNHWSEKRMEDVADSRQERLRTARELLLDVKAKLGKPKMVKVATIVRQLQSSCDRETRDELFDVLRGHQSLQRRFVEFLPKYV